MFRELCTNVFVQVLLLLSQHCGSRSPNPAIQFGVNPSVTGKEAFHLVPSQNVGGTVSFVSNDSTSYVSKSRSLLGLPP